MVRRFRVVFMVLIAALRLPGAAQAAPAEGRFVVHEWGTFTSLQGSDGAVQEGLHHEEEFLPAFVHGRDPRHEERRTPRCRFKCVEPDAYFRGPLQVTQKMETPVLYFHSDRERQVTVDIRFPNGIISQYFPAPVAFTPPIGGIIGLRNGSATFAVDVLKQPVALPAIPAGNVYGPAREVSADYLRSGSEGEKFIFYRGLGGFSTNFEATSRDGGLTLSNLGKAPMPAAFLLNVTPEGGSIRALGAIAAEGSLTVDAKSVAELRATGEPVDEFLARAGSLLTESLVATGLYADEARAMTETWKRSYFRTPGLRVLYVLSREETDAILPIQVTPEPTELVRTLVGRVEVLLDTEEQTLLGEIRAEGARFDVGALGRFGHAKLLRLQALAATSELYESIQVLIDRHFRD